MENASQAVNGSTTAEDLDRDEVLARAEIATLSVMFTVTVVGNFAVLLVLSARPRKKLSRMYYFILHLSIADLCTAFLSILPQLAWDVTYRFRGGPIMCKVVKYGQTLGPYLSAYILMVTALDRYQAVCHPLAYCSWTSRRSKFMVWTAWVFALGFCVPQLVVFSYQEIGPNVFDCWATFIQPWGERTYVTWYCVSVFIVPFTVLAATYSSICREIWLHAGRSPQQQGNCSPLISRAKMNTVKQMVAVLFLYVVCSAPFICAQLWATWDELAHTRPFFKGATFTILTLLYSLNSCMNPWIYLAFNRELVRILVQHIFCRTRDTASYKTGSGGSGSSTATVADPGLANGRKKAFTRFAHSTLVTKMSETEIAFPKNSKPETARQVSLLTTSLFSKNSVTTTCCTSGSDGDTVSPWGSTRAGQGFTRTGAIRKKNQCDTQRSPMEREDKKCFTYSFVSKSDDSVPKEVVEDLEPVVALLHGEPSGDECRRLQVHF